MTTLRVTAPTRPGALHAVEAVRLLNDLLAGRHRIPSDAVHLVLNRVRPVSLTPEEIVRAGKAQRQDFPPLTIIGGILLLLLSSPSVQMGFRDPTVQLIAAACLGTMGAADGKIAVAVAAVNPTALGLGVAVLAGMFVVLWVWKRRSVSVPAAVVGLHWGVVVFIIMG